MLQDTEIVLVRKRTALEYDQKRYDLSESAVIDMYYDRSYPGSKVDAIVDSHQRQLENLSLIREQFPEIRVVEREDLHRKETYVDAKLIIAFGGDNHFIYVAHFVSPYRKNLPILGVNSDSETSAGALLSVDSERIRLLKRNLISDELPIEEWPLLQVTHSEYPDEPDYALTDIYLGEGVPYLTSYNWVHGGEHSGAVHRGSGTLVATPAGATGWFRNANRDSVMYAYPRTSKKYAVTNREFCGHGEPASPSDSFELGEEQPLTVMSNNDIAGVVIIDSCKEFDFKFEPGNSVRIHLAEETQKIVNLQEE